MVHPPPGRGGRAGAHADPNAAQPRRARGVGSDEEDGEVDETPFGLSQQARLNEPVDPDKVEHLGDPRFARAFKLATFSDYFLVDGKQDPLAKHRIVKAKRKDWKEPANLERIPALPEKTKDRLAKALHKDALQDRAMLGRVIICMDRLATVMDAHKQFNEPLREEDRYEPLLEREILQILSDLADVLETQIQTNSSKSML